MCIDTDLFGDVIINVNEVDTWLDAIARMQHRTKSSREHYAQFYDVANKIKAAKLDGSYYLIISDYLAAIAYDAQPLKLFETKYKTSDADVKKTACPCWFHVCCDVNCACFIKRMQHEKSAKAYAKRKSRR